MKTRHITPIAALTGAIAAAAFAPSTITAAVAASPPRVIGTAGKAAGIDDRRIYIVRFAEPPLAMAASQSPAAFPRKKTNGRTKLDAGSASAKAYVGRLASLQAKRLAAIDVSLGRPVTVVDRLQYALNGATMSLTPAEAARVAKMPGVAAVDRDDFAELATDATPTFIGATRVWNGLPPTPYQPAVPGYFGDGVSIAVLDTGYNSASPAFAVKDMYGWTATNPNYEGFYSGHCAYWSTFAIAPCNDKTFYAAELRPMALRFERYEDTHGHGSHTASTAAGNRRLVSVDGYVTEVAGVAPHANVMSFRVCGTVPIATGEVCFDSDVVLAVEAIVSHGYADVINYSVTGGVSPWRDPVSLAFLSATEAGMFVAAAAGNAGPAPGTTQHLEPWVTTVAATTSPKGPLVYEIVATGTGAPPPARANRAFSSGAITGPLTWSLQRSPTFDARGDGCQPFAAGTFAGRTALVRYDATCPTADMARHAVQAGATAVVVASADEVRLNSGAIEAVPVLSVSASDGARLAAYAAVSAGATARVSYPPRRDDVAPDRIARFSGRGPALLQGDDGAAPTNLLKPDIAAPGVAVLAAVHNVPALGGANANAFFDGTSMASPHVAGAAALVRGLRPQWTPFEVKSALMMTSAPAWREDGTPADPHERGAGRVQVDAAVRAGLVLGVDLAQLRAADPAIGGDPSRLNLASIADASCVTPTGLSSALRCTFRRAFRSTTTTPTTWKVETTGEAGLVASPEFFTVAPGATAIVEFTANAPPADGRVRFGEIWLRPSDPTLPSLHLPASIALQPPRVDVVDAVEVVLPTAGARTTAPLVVRNAGGAPLTVRTTTGAVVDRLLHQPGIIDYKLGYVSQYAPSERRGQFVAVDFTAAAGAVPTAFTAYGAEGDLQPRGFPNIDFTFELYADAGGAPAGVPYVTAPLWRATAPAGSPALTIVRSTREFEGSAITLDVARSGVAAPTLAAGRYWLTVHATAATAADEMWGWLAGRTQSGLPDQLIATPQETAWSSLPGGVDVAATVEARLSCGAPWLGYIGGQPATVGGENAVTLGVTADGSRFPANQSYAIGYLCLQTNDPRQPVKVIRVTARRG